MKFAKVFQQVLTEEHLPAEWVDRAIQYKQLKKRINKVVEEFEEVGISKKELEFKYDLELVEGEIHPQLVIQISPLVRLLITERLDALDYDYDIHPIQITEVGSTASSNISAINPFDDTQVFYELKISLLQDTKFFQVLYNEIEELNNFETKQEKEITRSVECIAQNISGVTVPNMKRTDLYAWREIFQYYIESEIFFSTVERMAGSVDIGLSKERYVKFLEKINESKVLSKFHKKESQLAFNEFKKMNFQIIKISTYQNFNNLAVKKILKKFDKQTQLNSKYIFPELISNKINILESSIASDICFIISSKLLSVVPQIDDYLCPVCCSIAFKPIRLRCGHLFCIRCLVKLRRKSEDKCPLCREECLLALTVDDLDVAQMNYMKMYFPKEVREKEIENDREIIQEQYGPAAKPCIIM